jgi:2-(1,2-epoxy-1,2-dihydrophenyl)acetyl-CoA isomerase
MVERGRSPADGPVRLDYDGEIACVTMCRTSVCNALSPELVRSLRTTLFSPGIEEASALVLSGGEGVFSSGADLQYLHSAVFGETDALLGDLITDLHAVVARLRTLPIPVVGAIGGAAIGAGMGLALATDLRVMGRSGRMITGHLALNGSPDAGLSFFLVRALGRGRALAALLLNEELTAQALLDDGIVHEVVPDDEVMSAAVALARRVAGVSPFSLQAARRLVDAAPTQSLEAHLETEEKEFRNLWCGADFREGVTAWIERLASRTR